MKEKNIALDLNDLGNVSGGRRIIQENAARATRRIIDTKCRQCGQHAVNVGFKSANGVHADVYKCVNHSCVNFNQELILDQVEFLFG